MPGMIQFNDSPLENCFHITKKSLSAKLTVDANIEVSELCSSTATATTRKLGKFCPARFIIGEFFELCLLPYKKNLGN